MSKQIITNKVKILGNEYKFKYPNIMTKFTELYIDDKPFTDLNRKNRCTGLYVQIARLRGFDEEYQGLCALMQGNKIFKICNYVDVICAVLNGLYEITNISKCYVNFSKLNYTLVNIYNMSLTYTSATNNEINYVRRELRNQLNISEFVDKVYIIPNKNIEYDKVLLRPKYPWGNINYKALEKQNKDVNSSFTQNEIDDTCSDVKSSEVPNLHRQTEIKKRQESNMLTQEELNLLLEGEDLNSIPEISTTMNVEEKKLKSLFNSEFNVKLHIIDLVSVGAEQYARFSEFGDVLLPINKLLWND